MTSQKTKYWLYRFDGRIVRSIPNPTTMRGFILSVVLSLVAFAHPSVALTQQGGSESAASEQTFFEFQVEQPVRFRSGRAPVYPERLRQAKVEGEVLVQYVVDERGLVQMSSFKVLRSTDDEFTDAVRQAVGAMQFFPGEIRGKKVKQLVQQPFKFARK
jgi:TonB family protein